MKRGDDRVVRGNLPEPDYDGCDEDGGAGSLCVSETAAGAWGSGRRAEQPSAFVLREARVVALTPTHESVLERLLRGVNEDRTFGQQDLTMGERSR